MKYLFVIFLFNLALISSVIAGEVIPPKGSVAVSTLEDLLKTGSELGRAKIVVVYIKETSCPLHNGQLKSWMSLPQLTKATILPVTFTEINNNQSLVEMINDGEKKSGKFSPQLFFVDEKGKYLDVIPYKADSKVVKETIEKYIPTSGVTLTTEDAKMLNTLIDKSNKNIADKKINTMSADIR